tara:strand:+ start:123 stop:1112 length:990 start_codon:yes stop_codon:yes gene_type:complete
MSTSAGIYAHLLKEAGCDYTRNVDKLRALKRAFLVPLPHQLAFRVVKTGTGIAKEVRRIPVLTEHIYDNERWLVPPTKWPAPVLKAMHTNYPPSPYEFACFFFGRRHTHCLPGMDKRSYLAYFLLGMPISGMATVAKTTPTTIVKYMADAMSLLRNNSLAYTFFLLPMDPTPAFGNPDLRAVLRYVWDPQNSPNPANRVRSPKQTAATVLKHPYFRTFHESGYLARPTIRPWAPALAVWPTFQDKKDCLKVLSPRQCRALINGTLLRNTGDNPVTKMVNYPKLERLFRRYNAGEPPPLFDPQVNYVWKKRPQRRDSASDSGPPGPACPG